MFKGEGKDAVESTDLDAREEALTKLILETDLQDIDLSCVIEPISFSVMLDEYQSEFLFNKKLRLQELSLQDCRRKSDSSLNFPNGFSLARSALEWSKSQEAKNLEKKRDGIRGRGRRARRATI